MIEEVKTCPVDHNAGIRLFPRSKKDCGTKNALESFNQAPVMESVFRQAEEVEHLGRRIKTNFSRFLADSERGHPDRNQSILAEGQAEFGMADDLKEEMAVAARMQSLVSGRPTQWDTAENERSSMEGKVLYTIVTLLADELN